MFLFPSTDPPSIVVVLMTVTILLGSLRSAASWSRAPLFTQAVQRGQPGRYSFSSVTQQASSKTTSRSTTQKTTDQIEKDALPIYHPDDFGPLESPNALSPSSIMEFRNCPQSFLFQYIYKLRQPTNEILARGTMCHSALEQIFDLEPSKRTLEHLQNLLRTAWAKERGTKTYENLFMVPNEDGPDGATEAPPANDDDENDETENRTRDVQAERAWGLSALQLLDNYYQVEDPTLVTRPNPLRREVWLRSKLTIDPTLGATSSAGPTATTEPVKESTTKTTATSKDELLDDDADDEFLVRGIVDRVDMIKTQDDQSGDRPQVCLKIIDYKSGKAPNFKYSPAMNAKIREDNFFQLQIYALLWREKQARGGGAVTSGGSGDMMPLRFLELFYLTSVNETAQTLLYDLGKTQDERDIKLQGVHEELSRVWTEIQELVALQDPKLFAGCKRSFCYCHKCRPKFAEGTVWMPPDDK